MPKAQSPDGTKRSRAELLELWRTAQKILSRELRTGSADRTVFGGLERFLSNWSSSISSLECSYHTWPEAKRVLSLLLGYGQQSTDQRAAGAKTAIGVAEEVIARINALSAEEPTAISGQRSARTSSTPSHARSPRTSPAVSTEHSGPRTPDSALRTQHSGLALDDPIVALKGVGKLRASKLGKLGIQRVKDLLLHFPRDYRDYRTVKRIADLMYGETASVLGVVEDVQVLPGPKRRFRTTVRVRDESGRVSATWFRYGYGGVRVVPKSHIAVAGTLSGFGGQLTFESPDWEPSERDPLHTRRLVPVYPLTEGISDYWLRQEMAWVVPHYAPQLEEFLPSWLRQEQGLITLPEAVVRIHFPPDLEEKARARYRLAFDELFLVQLAAVKNRMEWRSGAKAGSLEIEDEALENFLSCQPFALTGAQRRVLAEIRRDLSLEQPMTRLLEGEVGSGKTIVAAVALLAAIGSGYQAALMAPTEILAEQHARTLQTVFGTAEEAVNGLLGRPLRLEVLTSASRRSDRERVYQAAAEGELDLLVGTQALIQEGLGFRRLGLAVIDEQHRFGVAQRSALREKGGTPHLLVMTATPIPRTLALTLYGDLDLSVIDELPPGRQQVKTHLLGPLERAHAYEHVRREVTRGRQAFIICPLVEDSPHLEVRAATAEYERLRQGELSPLRLALLHGRMRPAEKDRIMLDFRQGVYDVLVSTSVVEVGIDVPNATVMLVEGAERFGLAQLHQFRGRVGRGAYPSSCLLLTDSTEESSLERLRTVVSVSDGFRLADEDLRLRGPGEYFGLRQSGFPDFQMADLRDLRLVETAREAAARLLALDPGLAESAHQGLAQRLAEMRKAGSS